MLYEVITKFQNDVSEVTDKIASYLSEKDVTKLNTVKTQLIDMYKRNLVKINHSVLELICAANLIKNGYAVEVEKEVSDILVCDLYAKKGVITSYSIHYTKLYELLIPVNAPDSRIFRNNFV